jgi:hypothetical protein
MFRFPEAFGGVRLFIHNALAGSINAKSRFILREEPEEAFASLSIMRLLARWMLRKGFTFRVGAEQEQALHID